MVIFLHEYFEFVLLTEPSVSEEHFAAETTEGTNLLPVNIPGCAYTFCLDYATFG